MGAHSFIYEIMKLMKTTFQTKNYLVNMCNIVILILLVLTPQSVETEEKRRLSIAAVVNDQVITFSDLQKRVHLISVISPSQITGICLLYTSPSPRDGLLSRMPSSA